jgi:hypothetical protein
VKENGKGLLAMLGDHIRANPGMINNGPYPQL